MYQQYLSRGSKELAVYLNGTKIPWSKVWKEVRRSGAQKISNGKSLVRHFYFKPVSNS